MIHDLCVIMLTAGIVSLLFKLFKQPVVLGYIVAGLFAGPYMFGSSWIDDSESVSTWGQIGVLFLLFAMGLEFSFKKLIALGTTTLIAAGTIVVGMMSLGFLSGRLLGWDEMNSLFLGGMLCMSSTTIVFKAIEDMNMSSNKFASVAMGILIIEDMFAVVLMVLLSSIAVEKTVAGNEMLLQIGLLLSYLVLWFVVGIFVLPTFLRKFKKLLNDETLVIFVIGLCLGMVLLAVKAGFSSALGAFVMGSILSETIEAERIENLVQPVKNIFGAVFFVSVGMMIQPAMLAEYWTSIVFISLIVIIGQILFGTVGTLLSGQTLKVSLQTGFCLVQIGEFAFIIANLGESFGVTDSKLYPIVVAVSVVTTFLTPYVMRLSGPAEVWLNKRMSPGVKMLLENYYNLRNSVGSQSLWKTYLTRVAVTILVNGVILAFIDVFYFRYANPWIMEHLSVVGNLLPDKYSHLLPKLLSLVVVLSANAPFIYNIAARHRRNLDSQALWKAGNKQKVYVLSVRIFRIILSVGVVSYIIVQFFSLTLGFVAGISLLVVLAFVFSRSIRKRAHNIEDNFAANLTAREQMAEKSRVVGQHFVSSLLSYDVHIAEIVLPANSSYSGKTLRELNIRQNSGVSIVRVVRGGVYDNIPGGGKHLYPGDRIVVAGIDEQINKFKEQVEKSVRKTDVPQERTHVTLRHFTISAGSILVGRTIINSGIRDKAECIVMGIERQGHFIMNPEPTIEFRTDDTVLVAGETEKLQAFILRCENGGE